MFSCCPWPEAMFFLLPLILLKIQHESSAKNCSIVAWENVFETFLISKLYFLLFTLRFVFFFCCVFSRLRLVFVLYFFYVFHYVRITIWSGNLINNVANVF